MVLLLDVSVFLSCFFSMLSFYFIILSYLLGLWQETKLPLTLFEKEFSSVLKLNAQRNDADICLFLFKKYFY